MNPVSQYVIVRFRPFPETGEFANVGIIVFVPSIGELAFKLVPKRFRRVSQFFAHLEPRVFSAAVSQLDAQLGSIVGSGVRDSAFRQLVAQRESLWTYSDVRTVQSPEEPETLADRLFARYVSRNFVSPEYQETVMVRHVRSYLRSRNIVGFRQEQVDDDLVPITFPFVSKNNGTMVIRPIALNQKSSIAIIDHAATWHDRFKHLIRRGTLERNNILIPISSPAPNADDSTEEAYEQARLELANLGVKVVQEDDEASLLDFARRGAESRTLKMH